MWLRITKQMALDAGMTHEGTVMGVPCWLENVEDPDEIILAPKFYPMILYLKLAAYAVNAGAWLTSIMLSTDVRYDTPIVVRGRIE
jgi:hypothetical protein